MSQVISFNLGSLGFLTNHGFEDFREDLRDVIYGGYGFDVCSAPGEEIKVRIQSRHDSLLSGGPL